VLDLQVICKYFAPFSHFLAVVILFNYFPISTLRYHQPPPQPTASPLQPLRAARPGQDRLLHQDALRITNRKNLFFAGPLNNKYLKKTNKNNKPINA
jgi:hypothetical protein